MQTTNAEYTQVLEFLYNRLQAFHRVGATAYKPGLQTTMRLSEAFGNPHRGLRCIHVAGTNGKGSTAHTLAAILQAAGYKTGLYTSPHLVDFNERIRVDGRPISHEAVIDFARRFEVVQQCDPSLDPSFFELATIMAFEHFAREGVDIAVIETGLGGRLDSTNIITPVLSVITNISLDHTGLLGTTVEQIAAEKAGIIKSGVAVVVGEADACTRPLFAGKAAECNTPIVFAQGAPQVMEYCEDSGRMTYSTRDFGIVTGELTGAEQVLNANTILTAVQVLQPTIKIDTWAVRHGFEHVVGLTGLQGRWQKITDSPTVLCDTGHNPGAWSILGKRLGAIKRPLLMVIGFVADKDIEHIIEYLPRQATYYFVTPSTPRGAQAVDVAAKARRHGIFGQTFDSVADGLQAAKKAASPQDVIFVGGSNFVVADFLEFIGRQ